MTKKYFGVLTFSAIMVAYSSQSLAVTINFDDQGFTGPTTFAAASLISPTITIGSVDVTLDGGTFLSGATNLPGNDTVTYGAADFPSGGAVLTGAQNPITVSFSENITNFFLDVFNGMTVEASYEVSDNAGNSAIFSLPSNTSGGFQTIGFAATGDTVQIRGLSTVDFGNQFDFFIDNISFNEALPPDLVTPVPLPAGIPLMLSGLLGIGLVARRKKVA
ncbi:VPLPA-CTERM sorting domain-containing protein [Roseibium aggregatum]|uniref:VPLPA-CTERM sorting domain-containing protein n=1 Tax=Roseibium aggregatum TaxID=187304 RepID=A0A939J466_9HYPH|nr:VPLPA-CTERM sorting domain-containing protein [Roseibium aggregatum]MBN9671307.1 VPLPA-CTERM sorting domain-containing protein [Roseibium aggregatum]